MITTFDFYEFSRVTVTTNKQFKVLLLEIDVKELQRFNNKWDVRHF